MRPIRVGDRVYVVPQEEINPDRPACHYIEQGSIAVVTAIEGRFFWIEGKNREFNPNISEGVGNNRLVVQLVEDYEIRLH